VCAHISNINPMLMLLFHIAKIYHRLCFRCLGCNSALQPKSVAMMSGDMYCKGCFKRLFKARGRYDDITTVVPGTRNQIEKKQSVSSRRKSVGIEARISSLKKKPRQRSKTVSPWGTMKGTGNAVSDILRNWERRASLNSQPNT